MARPPPKHVGVVILVVPFGVASFREAANGDAYTVTLVQPHGTVTPDQRRIKLTSHPEFNRAPRTAADEDALTQGEVKASVHECEADCSDAMYYSGLCILGAS